MATKPTKIPVWNTGGTNNVEPTSGEKITGWSVGQTPPSSYFNFLQKLYGEWLEYLDDLDNHNFNWTAAHTFVGPADEVAITITGTDTGIAIEATGGGSVASNQGTIEAYVGSANGSALLGEGNGNGVGLLAQHQGGTDKTVIAAEGWISLNGATEPAAGATVGANRITPMNICKSWVKFNLDGAGGVSNIIGFNVSGVTVVAVGGGATIGFRVTFVDGFDSTSFAAVSTVMLSSNKATPGQLNREVNNAAYYEAGVYDLASAAQYNANTSAYDATVQIMFYGAS